MAGRANHSRGKNKRVWTNYPELEDPRQTPYFIEFWIIPGRLLTIVRFHWVKRPYITIYIQYMCVPDSYKIAQT